MRRSLSLLVPLASFVTIACSSSNAADGSSLANGQLAPLFDVTGASSDALSVNAAFVANGRFTTLPEGASLVAVVNGTRTPLPRRTDTTDTEEVEYAAQMPSNGGELMLDLLLERASGVAKSSILVPASFEIIDLPPSFAPGAEVTIGLSRPLAPGETVELSLLRGCFEPSPFAMTRSDASKVTFTLEGFTAFDTCDGEAGLEIRREGTLDPSFAREFDYEDAGVAQSARFRARQLRVANVHVVPR